MNIIRVTFGNGAEAVFYVDDQGRLISLDENNPSTASCAASLLLTIQSPWASEKNEAIFQGS